MKNKKILISIILLTVTIVSILVILFITNNNDGVKFKKEYESLNDTVRQSDSAKYNNIYIDKNNPIKYINSEEAINIIDDENAVIYVGANWCPWCRNAIPVLFEVSKKNNIETIYYLNLDTEKSNFEIKNGKLENVNKGTKGYYKLLDKLDSVLEEYILTDENGNEFKTGEKRIYMPFVFTVKSGKILDNHTGTVSLDDGQTKYDKMTKKQHNELYKKYDEMLEKIK